MNKERVPITPTEEQKTNEIICGPELVIRQRNILGLSQAQTAREAKITQGYLHQIENGGLINSPSYTVILNLAKVLGSGINFWEEGLNDKKVFLTHQAHTVNEAIQQTEASLNTTLLLSYVNSAIPEVEDPQLIYIDHFPILHS